MAQVPLSERQHLLNEKAPNQMRFGDPSAGILKAETPDFSGFSKAASAFAARVDQSRVTDAINKYRRVLHERQFGLDDQGGWSRKKCEKALTPVDGKSLPDQEEEALSDVRNTLEEQLTESQRSLFRQQVAPWDTANRGALLQHVYQEQDAYEEQCENGEIAAALQNAFADYQPELWNKNVESITRAVERKGQRKGWSKQVIDNEIQKQTSLTVRNCIDGRLKLAGEDPNQSGIASGILDAHRDQMTPGDYMYAYERVQNAEHGRMSARAIATVGNMYGKPQANFSYSIPEQYRGVFSEVATGFSPQTASVMSRVIIPNETNWAHIDPKTGLLNLGHWSKRFGNAAPSDPNKQAWGLTQVTAETAVDMARRAGILTNEQIKAIAADKSKVSVIGKQLLEDPKTNLLLGFHRYEYAFKFFKGDREKAIMAYGWGEGLGEKGAKKAAAKWAEKHPGEEPRDWHSFLSGVQGTEVKAKEWNAAHPDNPKEWHDFLTDEGKDRYRNMRKQLAQMDTDLASGKDGTGRNPLAGANVEGGSTRVSDARQAIDFLTGSARRAQIQPTLSRIEEQLKNGVDGAYWRGLEFSNPIKYNQEVQMVFSQARQRQASYHTEQVNTYAAAVDKAVELGGNVAGNAEYQALMNQLEYPEQMRLSREVSSYYKEMASGAVARDPDPEVLALYTNKTLPGMPKQMIEANRLQLGNRYWQVKYQWAVLNRAAQAADDVRRAQRAEYIRTGKPGVEYYKGVTRSAMESALVSCGFDLKGGKDQDKEILIQELTDAVAGVANASMTPFKEDMHATKAAVEIIQRWRVNKSSWGFFKRATNLLELKPEDVGGSAKVPGTALNVLTQMTRNRMGVAGNPDYEVDSRDMRRTLVRLFCTPYGADLTFKPVDMSMVKNEKDIASMLTGMPPKTVLFDKGLWDKVKTNLTEQNRRMGQNAEPNDLQIAQAYLLYSIEGKKTEERAVLPRNPVGVDKATAEQYNGVFGRESTAEGADGSKDK